MTSRERVLTSLDWRETDRPPIDLHVTWETHQNLLGRLGDGYRDRLGVDFHRVAPKWCGSAKEPHDDISYNMYGVGFKKVPTPGGATYNQVHSSPLANASSIDEISEYPWPTADDYDYSTLVEQCDQAGDKAVILGNNFMGPGMTNHLGRMRGVSEFMMDLAAEPEFAAAMMDKILDTTWEVSKRSLEICKGRIDIVHFAEDCGDQRGRRVSPAMFDHFWKPRLGRLFDLAHDFGAKTMMHSCGDTHEIMPDFIDMGLDILDSMQPEPPGMDPVGIRAACKGKLAFCGLLSSQNTLPFGSEEDCRREARFLLDEIAPGGGYIFCSSQSIQADTPVDNILAAYNEALKWEADNHGLHG